MGNQTLALIGATGFIGRHLLEALAPQPVRVLVYGTHPAWLPAMPHVQPLRGDLLAPASLDPLLEGRPLVVNLSGQVSSDQGQYQGVNLAGTINLARACLKQGVERVVHASSALVYGDALSATEETACRPVSPYATMKLAAEEILRCLLGADANLTCLRLSNVYGPYQTKGLMPYLIGCIRNNRRVTIDSDGAQVRDFVHVQDVAEAFVKALATPGCDGVINIGSGLPTSVISLLRLLEEILDVPVRGQYCPEHTGGERRNTVNIGRAAESLGWKARIGLPDGVRSVLAQDGAGLREQVCV